MEPAFHRKTNCFICISPHSFVCENTHGFIVVTPLPRVLELYIQYITLRLSESSKTFTRWKGASLFLYKVEILSYSIEDCETHFCVFLVKIHMHIKQTAVSDKIAELASRVFDTFLRTRTVSSPSYLVRILWWFVEIVIFFMVRLFWCGSMLWYDAVIGCEVVMWCYSLK